MSEPQFETFDDFWPFHLREHSQERTRQLHFLGTGAALATLAAAATFRSPRLALLAPLVGYGPAWLSHWLIEKNQPATFRYPRWSLQADLKMFSMMLNGTLDAELSRLVPQTDAPEAQDKATKKDSKAATAEALRLVNELGDSGRDSSPAKVWN